MAAKKKCSLHFFEVIQTFLVSLKMKETFTDTRYNEIYTCIQ